MDLYFDYNDIDQNNRESIIKNLEEQDGLMQMFGIGLKGVGEKIFLNKVLITLV